MLCQGFGKKQIPTHDFRICSSQATVHNYSGLLATRFFLGFAEAGVFPGSKRRSDIKYHGADT